MNNGRRLGYSFAASGSNDPGDVKPKLARSSVPNKVWFNITAWDLCISV